MTGTTDLMSDLGEARQGRDEARAEVSTLRAAIREWREARRAYREAFLAFKARHTNGMELSTKEQAFRSAEAALLRLVGEEA